MKRLPILLLLAALLSACGFHLRGAVALPPELRALAVTGTPENGPLWRVLRDALPRAGGRLTGPAAADAVLVITAENLSRRVLSVDSRGRAQEYELRYLLAYRLDSAEGRPLLDARRLTVLRQYRFDPDAVLAKGEEERRLQEEMRREAVGRLLRQITTRLAAPEPARAPAS